MVQLEKNLSSSFEMTAPYFESFGGTKDNPATNLPKIRFKIMNTSTEPEPKYGVVNDQPNRGADARVDLHSFVSGNGKVLNCNSNGCALHLFIIEA